MTGADHYAEAEVLLALVSRHTPIKGDPIATSEPYADTHVIIAAAQVHATLALAAAAAYPAIREYLGSEADEPRAWAEVTAP